MSRKSYHISSGESEGGMADLEADNASWARTAKDLVAGAAGGIAQVLLGKMSPANMHAGGATRF